MTLIIMTAGLLVPLRYGFVTLMGMRRKFIYPLLRFKARDGSLEAAKVTR